MGEIYTYDVISSIEEVFLNNGNPLNVESIEQNEVKEEIRYSCDFKMLSNESTKDSVFSVELDESKFLNDKNYEKAWFKVLYGDIILYFCLRYENEMFEIAVIEINELYRGEGLGRITVEGIEMYARNNGIEKIYVRPFDSYAESFWKHIGYNEEENGFLSKTIQNEYN